MAEKSFVHLHAHGPGSSLDGLTKVNEMIEVAKEQGMPGIALTDHGNMSAVYDLYKASKDSGVKPIFGIEAYLAPQVSRSHKEPVHWDNERGENELSGNGAYTHMTMLAKTDEGLHNLMKMSSEAFLTGQYYKPRMDEELLSQYGRGIIATSGCVSGEVQSLLRLGKYREAKDSAMKFQDIFGKGNFYIELMDHGLDIERQGLKDLIKLAKELGIPTLATNDLHYARQNDADTHEALLAIGTASTLNDPTRFKFDSKEFYIKSAKEMRATWAEIPEACDNTLLICESIEATFYEGKDLMPKFDVPKNETEASWLTKEVYAGLNKRFPNGLPIEYKERAEYELGVINQLGFASYFLVTADFIAWARANGIRIGPGRGSAAGSIIAYSLNITQLDPIRFGLLFERFLNIARATGADASPPDIDIDMDPLGREKVIEYVTNKYGADKVAGVATKMQLKGKSSIKDSARVLGVTYGLGDKINKLYPKPIVGRDLSLADLYDPTDGRYDEGVEFRNLVASDPEAIKVVELAKALEGTQRGFGQHAAAVILSREPIVNTVPVMKRDATSPVMTQFTYTTCEKLGLIKFDFLGLSNLATITECLRLIQKNKGIKVDLDEIGEKIDDKKTYDLLARGDTLGIFQLDSAPMRSLLRLMEVDSFSDISACLALYRPGPMGAGSDRLFADRKTGRKKVIPIHPELGEPLKDILGDTFQIIVYQEEIMQIAQKVAGYTLVQADLLRRAMGKKKKEILDKELEGFAAGMRANGFSDDCITTLWNIMVPFADYAFNLSHSAAYAMVSYWTAYLKANYPAEYMAALLSTNSGDKDKLAIYLAECRRMGLKVLSPDINLSENDYTAVGEDIRVGLASIKGVGEKSVEAWIAQRTERGFAKSFSDFLETADAAIAKKNVVAALIKAGAFDSFGKNRASLFLVYEEALTRASALKKGKLKKSKNKATQDSLFGEDDSDLFAVIIPDVPEWNRQELLAYERDMLGLYVSDHPLSDLTEAITSWADVSIADLKDGARVGTSVKIAGLVSSLERKVTKKGDPWALVTLEDLDANIPVYVFPKTYSQAAGFLARDAIVIITGRSEARDDGSYAFMASAITAPDLNKVTKSDPALWRERQVLNNEQANNEPSGSKLGGDPSDTRPIKIKVRESDLTEKNVAALKTALANSLGYRPVEVHVLDAEGNVASVVELEDRAFGNAALAVEIKYLFGNSAV